MTETLILHHYDTSPFSEKVRVALGVKGLAWSSVHVPNMMPKPDEVDLHFPRAGYIAGPAQGPDRPRRRGQQAAASHQRL